LILKDTTDGFLYFLVFETMYRDYPKEELEMLNKERNFKIFLNNEGVIKKVESL